MSSTEKRNLPRLDISGGFLYNEIQNMAKGNDYDDNQYHRYYIIFIIVSGLCDDYSFSVPQTDEHKILWHCHNCCTAVIFCYLFYSL